MISGEGMEFAELLTKHLRKARANGYPQYQIANDLHIDPSVISEYAKGAAVPPLNRLQEIVNLLGLSQEDHDQLIMARQHFIDIYEGVRAKHQPSLVLTTGTIFLRGSIIHIIDAVYCNLESIQDCMSGVGLQWSMYTARMRDYGENVRQKHRTDSELLQTYYHIGDFNEFEWEESDRFLWQPVIHLIQSCRNSVEVATVNLAQVGNTIRMMCQEEMDPTHPFTKEISKLEEMLIKLTKVFQEKFREKPEQLVAESRFVLNLIRNIYVMLQKVFFFTLQLHENYG